MAKNHDATSIMVVLHHRKRKQNNAFRSNEKPIAVGYSDIFQSVSKNNA